MAGMPGAGKSALARLIGRASGAVVLDKDVIKTSALVLIQEDSVAAQIAYETFFALADNLIGQGLPVVLDSPSFWPSVPQRGTSIAQERAVPYYFIECTCDDTAERSRRLRERNRLSSQMGEEALDLDVETVPPAGGYLRIDTTRPIDECLALALDYLGCPTGEHA
jgi:predicted kinase